MRTRFIQHHLRKSAALVAAVGLALTFASAGQVADASNIYWGGTKSNSGSGKGFSKHKRPVFIPPKPPVFNPPKPPVFNPPKPPVFNPPKPPLFNPPKPPVFNPPKPPVFNPPKPPVFNPPKPPACFGFTFVRPGAKYWQRNGFVLLRGNKTKFCKAICQYGTSPVHVGGDTYKCH